MGAALPIRIDEAGVSACILWVRAQPGAKRAGPCGSWNGHLKLALRAPAEGGRANEELRETLAALLHLRARDVELVSGERSRAKRVRLPLAAAEVRARLEGAGAG